MHALRPFKPVDDGTPWSCAQVRPDSRVARIHAKHAFDVFKEQQEYDPEVLSARPSWANQFQTEAPKNAKVSRTPKTDQAADWMRAARIPRTRWTSLGTTKTTMLLATSWPRCGERALLGQFICWALLGPFK